MWATATSRGTHLRTATSSCGPARRSASSSSATPRSRASSASETARGRFRTCAGKPQPEFGFVRALVHIAKLLKCKDADATDTLWALSYVTDDSTADNAKIQAVIEAGVVAPLVQFMDSSNGIVTPALRTVGNIVTGSDPQTQVALRCGALGVLKKLFTHSKGYPQGDVLDCLQHHCGQQGADQEVIKSDGAGAHQHDAQRRI